MKIQNKSGGAGQGGGGLSQGGGGWVKGESQSGSEQRIEVFVKIKKIWGGGGARLRGGGSRWM